MFLQQIVEAMLYILKVSEALCHFYNGCKEAQGNLLFPLLKSHLIEEEKWLHLIMVFASLFPGL